MRIVHEAGIDTQHGLIHVAHGDGVIEDQWPISHGADIVVYSATAPWFLPARTDTTHRLFRSHEVSRNEKEAGLLSTVVRLSCF